MLLKKKMVEISCNRIRRCIRGVWFNYFLFSFLLEIENNNKNVFGQIFKNIVSENIFLNKQKTKNNKMLFLFLENKKQDVKLNIFPEF